MSLPPTQLSALAAVNSGGGAPQDLSAFSEDGHPFIRAGSLSGLLDGKTEEDFEKIRPDVARFYRLKLFPTGTILFAKSGMSATKGHIYALRKPAYVVNHLAALVPHDDRDSSFLVHALRRFSPTSLIKDQAYPSIRLGDIERMDVMAPSSLDERVRIAAILDKADALRRKRQRAIDLLDSLTQSIFLEMFGDGRNVPSRRLGQVLSRPLRNGVSPAKSGTVNARVLTLAAITGKVFKADAVKEAGFAADPPPSQRVTEGELLICRGNGNKSLVGVGVIAPSSMPDTAFPDTIIAGRVDGRWFDLHFFEHVWNSPVIRQQIEQSARTTNGTFKVNQQVLERVKVPHPDRALQTVFGKRVSAIGLQRALSYRQLAHQQHLFASLQHRAFSGQL